MTQWTQSSLSFMFLNPVNVECVSMYAQTCACGCPWSPEEDVRCPGAGFMELESVLSHESSVVLCVFYSHLFPPFPSLPFSSLLYSLCLLSPCSCWQIVCMFLCISMGTWVTMNAGEVRNNLTWWSLPFILLKTGSLVYCYIHLAWGLISFWDSASHLALGAPGWGMNTITLSFTWLWESELMSLGFIHWTISQPSCYTFLSHALSYLPHLTLAYVSPISSFYEQKCRFLPSKQIWANDSLSSNGS